MKIEFGDVEEYRDAIKHLERYHDCEKCHGKIVVITCDEFGNEKCGYCGQIVKYPKLKKEVFDKIMEKIKNEN